MSFWRNSSPDHSESIPCQTNGLQLYAIWHSVLVLVSQRLSQVRKGNKIFQLWAGTSTSSAALAFCVPGIYWECDGNKKRRRMATNRCSFRMQRSSFLGPIYASLPFYIYLYIYIWSVIALWAYLSFLWTKIVAAYPSKWECESDNVNDSRTKKKNHIVDWFLWPFNWTAGPPGSDLPIFSPVWFMEVARTN